MRTRWPEFGVLLAMAVALVPGQAGARRWPSVGDKLSISVPASDFSAVRDAHLYAPIVQEVHRTSKADALAHPSLPGYAKWRSVVLHGMTSSQKGKVWELQTAVDGTALSEALQSCLSPPSIHRAPPWPAFVMRAAGVTVSIETRKDLVTLTFNREIGPLPALLSGCSFKDAQSRPSGAYFQAAPGVLTSRARAPEGPTPFGVIEFLPPGSRANLIGGSPSAAIDENTLLAAYPDVVLLLQSDQSEKEDRFKVNRVGRNSKDSGLRTFRKELSADLLLGVYWAGRGTKLSGILPPGVAPARPLPFSPGEAIALPLSLAELPASAPQLKVFLNQQDPLLQGVGERLAVLLRSRGVAANIQPDGSGANVQGVEVMRWRPPIRDPALALLALAGQRPALLFQDQAALLIDADLLSFDAAKRLEAAMKLERQWLQSRRVVPLMTAERWFFFDRRLRGVQVRDDGVPILSNAYLLERQ